MFAYKILDIPIYLMGFSFGYMLCELFPKLCKTDDRKTFITYFRSILLTVSCVMFIWLLFNKERFHWSYDISTGEPVDHYSTYGRCITFTVIALVSNILGIVLRFKRNRKQINK